MTPGDDLAPSFAISVNGLEIDPALARLVTSIEYLSRDGGADQMNMTVSNPELILSDKKIFSEGNVIRIWSGFGPTLKFLGGAKVYKVRDNFPGGQATPTIEIVGYTEDKRMMSNSPASDKEEDPFSKKKKKSKKKKGPEVRTWPELSLYSEAIKQKAQAYGFAHDIDETPIDQVGKKGIIQRTGMNDFVFAFGIANDLGWLFWVDAREQGGWTLHFKNPNLAFDIQDRELDLVYNSGNATTLLDFDGERLLGDEPTSVQIQIKNPRTNKLETFSVNTGEDLIESPEFIGVANEINLRPPRNAQEVTIAFGGTSTKVIADRIFSSPAEVKSWLRAWARKNSESFVTGRGIVRGPGIETVTARQVHSVRGLPSPYSGRYYFTSVSHKITSQSGYQIEWNGRKIPGSDV